MAEPTIEQLRAENERLSAENARLQTAAAGGRSRNPQARAGFWRPFGAVAFSVLAVVLLVAGNVLLWAGNTVVKSDRFAAATAPIVRDPTVQKAIASYTTKQLYSNVDVTATVQDALPPRAEFLAPTIADQLHSHTESALQSVLGRTQFQERWNNLLQQAHDKFINVVKQSGGDGVISLNDLYQQLSASLKNTRLSFLADKQLPSKVGNIQIAKGEQITMLHRIITHIDIWRWTAIILFVIFAGLAIFLARRRRRMVMRLALLSAAAMLATLIAVRIARAVIADQANPAYADAAGRTAQIIMHPLAVQTAVILALFLVIAIVAWLTGQSRSAVYAQQRVQLLFAGKLHGAVFGRENAFTRWVGRYKRTLQWIAIAVVAIALLVVHISPAALLWSLVVVILLVLIIEFIAAPEPRAGRQAR